ncbi:hypothetical protein [Deinococcus fonticola]|uniref:hypothetical protein n=1 Tax=Deinococcus fonticola TaxID=2528713 RepID=UPI001074A5BC|nr:hypothetical protein [Deinococcus fonticola]
MPKDATLLDAQTLIGIGSNLINLALGEAPSLPDLLEAEEELEAVLDNIRAMIEDVAGQLDVSETDYPGDLE